MAKKLSYMSVFTAFAVILSYIEVLIPFNFGIPGMKLGLANLAIVLAIYYIGAKEALLINIIRIVIIGLLFGNVFSILFSLAGGLFSFLLMYICKKTGLFNIITISAVGGVSHNVGQLVVASFVVKTYGILYYIPVLIITGLITGILIGIVASIIRNKIKPGLGGVL